MSKDMKDIQAIIERLRELNVPDKALIPIEKFNRENSCNHKDIIPPQYYASIYGESMRLATPPICKNCDKVFDVNEVHVVAEKAILKETP